MRPHKPTSPSLKTIALVERPRIPWLAAFAIASFTALVFSGALSAEFVKWDDDINITRNTRLQNLSASSLAWMFTDLQSALRYKPLSWLTWAIVYAASGSKPLAYHAMNLFFHALNAALVFVLIHRLLSWKMREAHNSNSVILSAVAAALCWAWHPMRVEPVVWATGLPYDESLCCALLSALCYWRAGSTENWRRTRRVWYWLSVGTFVLAVLTYPTVLTLGVGLLAMDWYRLRTEPRAQPGAKLRVVFFRQLPFMVVAILPLAAALYARAHASGPWPKAPSLAEFTLAERAMQACYVWAWYFWKALWPFNLSPVYTRLVSFHVGDAPFVCSLAGVVAFTGILIWQRCRWPNALLLWLTYLALMIPVLGLTEHPHYASDRYSLLAHVVDAIVIGAMLMKWMEFSGRRRGAVSAASIVLAVCALLSMRQTLVWRNSETLFGHMVKTLHDDPYRAEILWRLGEVQALQGRFKEAQTSYEESIRIDPNIAAAHNGLGELRAQQGQWKKALTDFSQALDRQPGFLRALNNIAWTLATADDSEVRNGRQALDLARALNERSGVRNAQFLETLAAAYAETGDFTRAVATAEQIPSMAKLSGEYEVAARNEKLIQLYRAGQPYRQGNKIE